MLLLVTSLDQIGVQEVLVPLADYVVYLALQWHLNSPLIALLWTWCSMYWITYFMVFALTWGKGILVCSSSPSSSNISFISPDIFAVSRRTAYSPSFG
mmetsp:Transcript_135408/g.234854  ORF Transcript_135408/g.234854 Transcript_135408/m.234854 type:complete len:98 (+) Transcript_135408:432-725(+)